MGWGVTYTDYYFCGLLIWSQVDQDILNLNIRTKITNSIKVNYTRSSWKCPLTLSTWLTPFHCADISNNQTNNTMQKVPEEV